jgi:hypothetical protein
MNKRELLPIGKRDIYQFYPFKFLAGVSLHILQIMENRTCPELDSGNHAEKEWQY